MHRCIYRFNVAALMLAGSFGCAQSPLPRQEARLAEILDGRVASAPVSCIAGPAVSAPLLVLDQIGVVFDAGDVVYVARINARGKFDGADRVLFRNASPNTLCKGDKLLAVHSDRSARTETVQLPEFVPYVKFNSG